MVDTTPSHPNRWAILAVLCLSLLVVVIDVTVLHVAAPAISADLDPTALQLLWIIDVYPLVAAPLLLASGVAGDRLGRKSVLLVGYAVFGFASLAAAFAPTAEALIAARALLGVGGALIMPATMSIIRDAFRDRGERIRAVGIWSATSAGGAALGPLVGGFLVEHWWWGSVFLINIPILLLVMPFAVKLVPDEPRRGPAAVGHGRRRAGRGRDPRGRFRLQGRGAIRVLRCQGTGRDPARITRPLPVHGQPAAARAPGPQRETVREARVLGCGRLRIPRHVWPGRDRVLRRPVSAARARARAPGCRGPAAPADAGHSGRRPARGPGAVPPGDEADHRPGPRPDVAGAGPDARSRAGRPVLAALAALHPDRVRARGRAGRGQRRDHLVGPGRRSRGAAAIEETAYELGSGFGVAVLGSVLAIAYSSNIRPIEGVSSIGLDTAKESLSRALDIAERMPSSMAEPLIEGSRLAFMSGYHTMILVSVAILGVSAVVSGFCLRKRPGADPPRS